ncbi:MAG: acetyl-CoA synthetase [Actinomycetota bacterium]
MHCLSWEYDDPGGRLAARLGRPEMPTSASILAGTSPQRLIDKVAALMVRGECSAAVVVGAEAAATLGRYEAVGETVPWSFPSAARPSVLETLDTWYLPTERRHGVLPAWLTFALLEQARWAKRGASAEDRRVLGERMAGLSRVAARTDDAWFRVERTPEELLAGGPDNRLVVTPYSKAMTAFPAVDMAAANVVVTTAVADAWGVPEEWRVHLRGSGFARDASHVAGRTDLAGSAGMRAATTEALRRAGVTVDRLDGFDLYSCFGAAIAFAADALGLADDDPRPITFTGGLPYYGGPGSNYMSHSISHVVDAIRAGRAGNVMVTGVGMHMTKHVAAVWSADPGPLTTGPIEEQHNVLGDDPVEVADEATGPCTVEAAAAVYARSGAPERAVAICGLEDGRRCYAVSEDVDVVAAGADGGWVDTPATVRSAAGINALEL